MQIKITLDDLKQAVLDYIEDHHGPVDAGTDEVEIEAWFDRDVDEIVIEGAVVNI